MQPGVSLSYYPIEYIQAQLEAANPELGSDWAAQRAQEIKYGTAWGVTGALPSNVSPEQTVSAIPGFVAQAEANALASPEYQAWAVQTTPAAAQGITPETGVGLIGGAQPISTQSELDAYLANAAATGQW
jgi:hypothetical protein